jgi:hypothetical protein
MKDNNHKVVDAERVSNLLANKEAADRDVYEEMKRYALFEGKVSGVMDSDYADSRIVSVVYEGDTANKLLDKIDRQIKANEELVEAAPMYFTESSQSFRKPVVLRNVTKLKVTINTAVASQKKTGLDLVARYERAIRRNEREINKLRRKESREKRIELIKTLMQERDQFAKQPDKVYRIRTKGHDDVIALFSVKGGPEAMEKMRVNVGGLIAIKDRDSSLQDFSVKTVKKEKSSVYSDMVPIPNSLGLNGLLYDEAEAEKIREMRKQERSQNEEKIRPKGDDIIN